MKLSTFLLSVLALFPLSDAVSSGRKKKKVKPTPPAKKTFVGSVVTLSHVRADKPDVDPLVFAHCFIDAFNEVFKSTSFTLEDGFTSKTFKVPEDDGSSDGDDVVEDESLSRRHNWGSYSGNTIVSWWSGSCGSCSSDNWQDDDVWNYDTELRGSTMLRRLASTSAGKHKAFEAALCYKLISTGDPSLAELRHCSVEFTYAANAMDAFQSEPAVSVGATTTPPTTGTLRCHLDIDYVYGSTFNPGELEITGQIFRDSYNLIHAGMGHKITKVEFLRRIDLPDDPASTGPKDYYDRIWWMKAEYECVDNCKRLPPVAATLDHGLHKAFEDLVCLKLQASGLPTYHHSRDCDIAFALEGITDLFPLMEG